MNLKKFISGISALAIAASAFAGLAVTASAEAVSDSIYGQIIGIDFGDTNSSSPYANTVDLSSATIDGYTYTTGDGNFSDTNTSNITTTETKLGKNSKAIPGANHYLVSNTTQSVTIPSGLRVDTTKDKVKFTFKYVFGNLINRLAGFFIKDEDGTTLAAYYSSRYSGITTSGTINTFGVPSALGGSSYDNGAIWTDPVDFDITLDYATKKMTANIEGASYTVDMPSGAKAPATFEVKSNYDNAGRYSLFDDLAITNIEGEAVSLYDYTLEYQCNGTTVKTVNGSEIDGAVINAVNTRFTGDDTYASKNYFVDDETTSFTVSATGNNTFTVNVREANIYNVGAVSSTGVTLKEPISVVEGDTLTYQYPKYLTDEYNNIVATCNESSYSQTATPTQTQNYTVSYTAFNGTGKFIEFEDVVGATGDWSGNGNASSAKLGRANNSTTGTAVFSVPSTGWYTVTTAACRRSNTDTWISVYADTSEIINVPSGDVPSVTTIKTTGTYTADVYLTAGQEIKVAGATSDTDVDYVSIVKLGDYRFNFTDGPVYVYGNSGDSVYLPSPADTSFKGWMIDDTYYAGGTSYTFTDHDVDATVANSPVEITNTDKTTTEYEGETYTLAKLLVNITGTVKNIAITYDGKTRTAKEMPTITNSSVVLGAIVAGDIEVDNNTFSVTAVSVD